MAWRGPRTANDPLLSTRHWRYVVRPYWQALRLPCARCGRDIDYDGPTRIGTRWNRRGLVVGHKVSRRMAKRLGWTEQQINSIENSQPECRACSNKSGARLGQRVQSSRRVASFAANADRW